MIGIVSIILAGIAAAASVFGLGFVYVSHSARKRSELPRIQMYVFQASMDIYSFRLETDQHSIGWEVERVEVIDSNMGFHCLSQDVQKVTTTEHVEITSSDLSDWQEYCDFPKRLPGLFQVFYVHSDCIEASLSFICKVPSRGWWNRRRRKRIFYRFVRGTIPFMKDDPTAAFLFNS